VIDVQLLKTVNGDSIAHLNIGEYRMVRGRKPDINTKFHIDFDWWAEGNRNFRVILHSHLCPECRALYPDYRQAKDIDWIDQETAEVRKVDGLWQCLRTHCSHRPDYISSTTPLTSAIFRVFLANENSPLSSKELYEIIGRKDPATLLRLLTGSEAYKGIRPVDSEGERE
jgi:hypothetical protein